MREKELVTMAMATKFPLIPNKIIWLFSILHFHTKFGRKLIPGGEIANRFGPGNWVSGSPSPEIKTHNHLQAMNVDTFNVVKRSHLLVCG